MKKIYCTAEHPETLIVELEEGKSKVVTEELFREELQRLVDLSVEEGNNPVHQAMDQLYMRDVPTSPSQVVESMMLEDPMQVLLKDVKGLQLVEAPEEMVEEYQRRTLNSFLVEIMPDQNN